jgi:hypothetical protein
VLQVLGSSGDEIVVQDLLTDCNCECEQSEAGQGILEEIWPTGTQEGGTRAVVLAVVGGVEAEQMLAGVLPESGGHTYIPVAILRGCRRISGRQES